MYKRLSFGQYFIDTSQGFGVGANKMSIPYFNYDELIYKHHDHEHTAHYKVMYIESRDVIQIHFQGTVGKNQWIANFEFAEQYYDKFRWEGHDIQLRVHSGWGSMYKGMKHVIREQFEKLHTEHPTAEVEILGWSLGSSQAMLCCQDLFYNFGIKSHVFTYGSVKPWFGCNKHMRAYLRQCYKECYNFGDHNDIVTYMVPFLGYFKFNKVKIKQDSFCIAKLFNPMKYHTEYYKEEYYTDII